MSSLFLNAFVEGAFTTSLGRLFQRFAILFPKNLILQSALHFSFLILKPWSLVEVCWLNSVIRVNGFLWTSYNPLQYLNASIMSPRIYLNASEGRLSAFSLSSYSMLNIPGSSLVARRCTFSMSLIWYWKLGLQTQLPYSKIGLTSDVKSLENTVNLLMIACVIL